ncbi:hypothetical protein JKG68_19800 [Microvirga aerilata]|uniref:Uncharacterized protein n=1 Tax=Microvirga aerilata TaxID=670292 RepID=A0A936ZKB6_9HYPH|nr:hypothetical protein [Microvirga aerilata]MBL0406208.1 hypothetical protein [Microvirga aerilata]
MLIQPVVLMIAIKRGAGLMSLYRTVLAIVVTALFCLGPARAQERTIRVGVPGGALVQSVQVLAPAFQAETGIDNCLWISPGEERSMAVSLPFTPPCVPLLRSLPSEPGTLDYEHCKIFLAGQRVWAGKNVPTMPCF